MVTPISIHNVSRPEDICAGATKANKERNCTSAKRNNSAISVTTFFFWNEHNAESKVSHVTWLYDGEILILFEVRKIRSAVSLGSTTPTCRTGTKKNVYTHKISNTFSTRLPSVASVRLKFSEPMLTTTTTNSSSGVSNNFDFFIT